MSQIIQLAAKSHDIGPLLQLDSPSAAAPLLALRDGLSLDAALTPLASPSLEIPTVWELLIAESKPRKHLTRNTWHEVTAPIAPCIVVHICLRSSHCLTIHCVRTSLEPHLYQAGPFSCHSRGHRSCLSPQERYLCSPPTPQRSWKALVCLPVRHTGPRLVVGWYSVQGGQSGDQRGVRWVPSDHVQQCPLVSLHEASWTV
jgi:hypothetical protein